MKAKDIKERICNPTAERCVISIIMKDISKTIECSALNLKSEHFAIKINKTIYLIICQLSENSVTELDSNLIFSMIKDEESLAELDTFGGVEYLDMLFQSSVVDNINMYIKIIKSCYTRRSIYQVGEDLRQDVIDIDDEVKLMQDAQTRILGVMADGSSNSDAVKMGTNLMERLNERAEKPSDVFGYEIGWEKFDKVTQGLAGNDLAILVGPSKTGKSTWLLNVAKQLSITGGLKGLYIDTEMSSEEQEDRLISLLAEVPHEEIRNGFWAYDSDYGKGAEKKIRVQKAVNLMKGSNLTHIYMPDFDINKVSACIRQHKIQQDIDYAIFDYIKMPNSDVSSLNSAQEYQRLGYFTTCLKDMAGICDIPIISACQSNRSNTNSTDPDVGDIGGSLRILQLATKLFFIRRKTAQELENEGYSKGNMKLHIKYQRNGAGDKEIDVHSDLAILRMKEV